MKTRATKRRQRNARLARAPNRGMPGMAHLETYRKTGSEDSVKRRTQQAKRIRRGAAGGRAHTSQTRPDSLLGQPRQIWTQVERRRGSFAP